MKNRIKKVLEKFNIEHIQYGDRDSDAIEFKINGTKVTLSAFDDDIEICCGTVEDLETGESEAAFITYEDIVENLLYNFVNHKGD